MLVYVCGRPSRPECNALLAVCLVRAHVGFPSSFQRKQELSGASKKRLAPRKPPSGAYREGACIHQLRISMQLNFVTAARTRQKEIIASSGSGRWVADTAGGEKCAGVLS